MFLGYVLPTEQDVCAQSRAGAAPCCSQAGWVEGTSCTLHAQLALEGVVVGLGGPLCTWLWLTRGPCHFICLLLTQKGIATPREG